MKVVEETVLNLSMIRPNLYGRLPNFHRSNILPLFSED